ncbi:MAG: S9 family peptidase [Pseudomonadales bacterium]|nr:S9 family peptidase [Pseudomonadales bacterium]
MIRILLLFLAGCSALAQDLPASEYGKLPPVHSISLSPDGKKLVMLRAMHGTYHAVVTNLVTQKSRIVMAADPAEFHFDSCRFANNERIVCRIRKSLEVSGRRNNQRARIFATTLLAVNADGSNVLQLVRRSKRKIWSYQQSNIIHWLPEQPDEVLIQLLREDTAFPSVYRLNIVTNRLMRVQKFRKGIVDWVIDDQGQIVASGGVDDAGKVEMYVPEGKKFRQLNIDHLTGSGDPSFLGVAADNKSVWVSANFKSNTAGIHRISLRDASVLETIAHEDKYDMNTLQLDSKTNKPLYATVNRQGIETIWFDNKLAAEMTKLQSSIPGKPSNIAYRSKSNDLSKIILQTDGNGTSPAFYLYDRTNGSLAKISDAYTGLGALTDLQSVSYQARDGLEIPAYIALPGPIKDGPWPTIILPHGGPYLRDTNRFDYWVQFFLSRGYAVLKPNFRGSSGYGFDYLSKGYKQWGLKMQDDVIDGLDWMIEQGYADANKTCIVGGSYGGYVALVAAYKSPDRFQCTVAFAAVTDLDKIRAQWRRLGLTVYPDLALQGGASRIENSPMINVGEIALPLLLIHGDVDTRVKVEQSREFAIALEAADKEVIYIEQKNGDHFLSQEHHRIQLLEAMDVFLGKHIGTK